jgi:hypothetical protein
MSYINRIIIILIECHEEEEVQVDRHHLVHRLHPVIPLTLSHNNRQCSPHSSPVPVCLAVLAAP